MNLQIYRTEPMHCRRWSCLYVYRVDSLGKFLKFRNNEFGKFALLRWLNHEKEKSANFPNTALNDWIFKKPHAYD